MGRKANGEPDEFTIIVPAPTREERARRVARQMERLSAVLASQQGEQLGALLAANWQLLYSIAWDSSEGLRLLTKLRPMVISCEIITSAEIVRQLNADKYGEWCKFRGKGPITQRQVAALLGQYEVVPITVHPVSYTHLTLPTILLV